MEYHRINNLPKLIETEVNNVATEFMEKSVTYYDAITEYKKHSLKFKNGVIGDEIDKAVIQKISITALNQSVVTTEIYVDGEVVEKTY